MAINDRVHTRKGDGVIIDQLHGGAQLLVEFDDGEIRWFSWTKVSTID